MMELKPCPFCGGEQITVKKGKYMWWCKCEKCNAESGVRSKKADAITVWNRRVGDDLMERMEDDGK